MKPAHYYFVQAMVDGMDFVENESDYLQLEEWTLLVCFSRNFYNPLPAYSADCWRKFV